MESMGIAMAGISAVLYGVFIGLGAGAAIVLLANKKHLSLFRICVVVTFTAIFIAAAIHILWSLPNGSLELVFWGWLIIVTGIAIALVLWLNCLFDKVTSIYWKTK
jgi:hypothetical protein